MLGRMRQLCCSKRRNCGAHIHLTFHKPIELPPATTRSFVKDMRLSHATKDSTKKDEIAARQAWLLSKQLGPRERRLPVIDAREMFVEMRIRCDERC